MTKKLDQIDFYYFSPTGGTKKTGLTVAQNLAERVFMNNIGKKGPLEQSEEQNVIFAVPVFSGRLPAFAADKIKTLNGEGKNAVIMVVYGVRAYEDALIELYDLAAAAGFNIVGAAAVVAQHSIVPQVGAGRPNEQDEKELTAFAANVLQNINDQRIPSLNIPGNHPYKDLPNNTNTPTCTDACNSCGVCINTCPLAAISKKDGAITTDAEPCILCMSCVAACPMHARTLSAAAQEGPNKKLAHLKDTYRENEFYV